LAGTSVITNPSHRHGISLSAQLIVTSGWMTRHREDLMI
jgi:hypothetical protein